MNSTSGKSKKKARAQQRRGGATRAVLRPPRGQSAAPAATAEFSNTISKMNPTKLQQQLKTAMRAGRLTPQQRKMCESAQAMLQQLQSVPPPPRAGASEKSSRPILRPPRAGTSEKSSRPILRPPRAGTPDNSSRPILRPPRAGASVC